MQKCGILYIEEEKSWYTVGPARIDTNLLPMLITGPHDSRGEALSFLYYPEDNPKGFQIPSCEFETQ